MKKPLRAANSTPRSFPAVRFDLSVLIALLVIGASLVWSSTVSAQTGDATRSAGAAVAPAPATADSLAQRVRAGHAEVRQGQLDYVAALGQPKGEVAASAYVELLRQELKDNLRAAIRGGSSEVELAVERAAVEHRLTLINAYEAALGTQPSLATTRFNVFTYAELVPPCCKGLRGSFGRWRYKLSRLSRRISRTTSSLPSPTRS